MSIIITLQVGYILIGCKLDVFKSIHEKYISDEKFNITDISNNTHKIESRNYKDLYFLLKMLSSDITLDIRMS